MFSAPAEGTGLPPAVRADSTVPVGAVPAGVAHGVTQSDILNIVVGSPKFSLYPIYFSLYPIYVSKENQNIFDII